MNRRNFIKAASCGALLTGALPSVSHAAAESRPPIPGSLGMLYDSTLCVGCQACVTKCQDINFLNVTRKGNRPGRTTTNCRRIPITSFRCGPAAQGSTKTRRRMATRTLRNSVCTASIRTVSLCARSRAEKDPKTALSITTKMCTAAVTAWSPAHTTCRSTTTTTRLVRCISASCATRKVWNVSIKAVCLAA